MTTSTISLSIVPPTDPVTPEEWQNAVDAARAMLALDSARQYGLVRGGPDVNVERCADLLERGRLLGVEPSADAVERYVGQCGVRKQ